MFEVRAPGPLVILLRSSRSARCGRCNNASSRSCGCGRVRLRSCSVIVLWRQSLSSCESHPSWQWRPPWLSCPLWRDPAARSHGPGPSLLLLQRRWCCTRCSCRARCHRALFAHSRARVRPRRSSLSSALSHSLNTGRRSSFLGRRPWFPSRQRIPALVSAAAVMRSSASPPCSHNVHMFTAVARRRSCPGSKLSCRAPLPSAVAVSAPVARHCCFNGASLRDVALRWFCTRRPLLSCPSRPVVVAVSSCSFLRRSRHCNAISAPVIPVARRRRSPCCSSCSSLVTSSLVVLFSSRKSQRARILPRYEETRCSQIVS